MGGWFNEILGMGILIDTSVSCTKGQGSLCKNTVVVTGPSQVASEIRPAVTMDLAICMLSGVIHIEEYYV